MNIIFLLLLFIINNKVGVFMMFNNADIKFEPFSNEQGEKTELTIGRYVKFLESRDRNVRRRAFRSMYEAYGSKSW